ncbi:MAG: bifunctional metallophosphatase/5'-nucleotidase [Erysipelotrichaceae bacterium]|nr:bifunctional metallophosphatase/5'-nucleotidase [Erysipelotrichaceae bacterium]
MLTLVACGETAPKKESKNPETEITILYTNDVHAHVDEDLTYASVAALKKDLTEQGKAVLLVDAGDHVQGTAYGALDNGASIVKLMGAAGYDAATLGNHEFDYGMARALEIVSEAEYPYLSCNFKSLTDNKNVLDSYKMFEVGGVKVAIVGITTPETITKSTPAYFMDENQEKYIYEIAAGDNAKNMISALQTAINDAIKEGANYVVALGHVGVDSSSEPYTSEKLIAGVSGLDAFIDGHSHSEVPSQLVQDKDGKDVVLTQTGNYFDAIGKLTISVEGAITTELVTEYEAKDETVAAMEEQWILDVGTQLAVEIANTEIEFRISSPEGIRMVRSQETNLGDFCADAVYWYMNEVEGLNCDMAYANGGGVRADVESGVWTYLTAKTVNPFGNTTCLISITGQQVLDMLEFGAKSVGVGESGGFMQMAGVKYDINPAIEATIPTDENGVWQAGPTGEYRVTNVQVYDKETKTYVDLDLAKTYTIGGSNYTLRSMGDGFNMFTGYGLVKDYICEDYLLLSAYARAFADANGDGVADLSTATSPLAAYEGYLLNYEDINGSGRITIVTAE